MHDFSSNSTNSLLVLSAPLSFKVSPFNNLDRRSWWHGSVVEEVSGRKPLKHLWSGLINGLLKEVVESPSLLMYNIHTVLHEGASLYVAVWVSFWLSYLVLFGFMVFSECVSQVCLNFYFSPLKTFSVRKN